MWGTHFQNNWHKYTLLKQLTQVHTFKTFDASTHFQNNWRKYTLLTQLTRVHTFDYSRQCISFTLTPTPTPTPFPPRTRPYAPPVRSSHMAFRTRCPTGWPSEKKMWTATWGYQPRQKALTLKLWPSSVRPRVAPWKLGQKLTRGCWTVCLCIAHPPLNFINHHWVFVVPKQYASKAHDTFRKVIAYLVIAASPVSLQRLVLALTPVYLLCESECWP